MHSKDPWIGMNGKSHKGLCMISWLSFQDCIQLHKLTIFPADAAEKQCIYMQQMIKKPQQGTVCQYMSCMGVLNDYLDYLPTVYDSSMAIEGMKKSNWPFNKADLAGIVLNWVLVTWVNQYNMMHSMLPKSLRLSSASQTRSTRQVSRQRQRKQHLLLRVPRVIPKSVLHLGIPVNYL